MAFFRKAFNKISNAPDGSSAGTLKTSASTAALPALSFQHDFSEALWDGTSPQPPVPIRMSNSNSSTSPSSRISLAEKDSGFKTDDSAPFPPPKSMFAPGSYKEAPIAPPMPLPKTDGGLPRHKNASSFRPFLANLAGLKISSLDKDKADTHEPDLSPLPINGPEDLSSSASTPIDNLPPPPSRGRRHSRRKRRQQNITAVVQSLAGPTYLSYVSPQAVDPTKRLEEAAIQARLNAAIATESSGVLPKEPAVSYVEDDEGPSIHVEANVDIEPAPSDPLIRSEDNVKYSPPQFVDDLFPWYGPPVQEQPYTNNDSTLEYLYGTLEKLDSTEKIHHQSLKDDKVGSTVSGLETQIPETRDIHDYSSSLIDDYAAPSTTPPPIPSVRHASPTQTQHLEEEIHLLRSRLTESKARIDALAEEKLRTTQRHHQEVLKLSDSVKSLEQKEIGYHTRIEDLLSENKHIKEDRDDVVQQLRYQIEENENLENANKELQKDSLAFREFKLKMRDNEAEFQRLSKEKDCWQGQIDDMHQRLSDAERRVRCLDAITRRKYEAKQEGAYGSGSTVGRSTKLHFSPHVKGPSMDLISSVTAFNEEVLQTASYIVEHLEEAQSNSTFVTSKVLTRAEEVWGSKVVAMLQQQAPNSVGSRLNFLLLQNCLEVFMTHWCVQIAEGLYPKQPSFSDILVELTAQTHTIGYNSLGNSRLNSHKIVF